MRNCCRRALGPVLSLMLLSLLLPSSGARATVLTVGVGQQFATLAAAVAAAAPFDTIAILAGTYTNQTATLDKPVTLRGFGGTPVFTATGPLANRKGFLIVNADTSVDNIAFTNAQVTDVDGGNGAGIRHQGGTLTVTNSRFIGNQDGILSTPLIAGTGALIVRASLFLDNGMDTGPHAGFDHAIYATGLDSVTVQDSRFAGTKIGHDIKSRAARTLVERNYLDDGVSGSASYAIDLPNGGIGIIRNNTIAQGPATDNQTMIAYAAEGVTWTDDSLTVFGNLFTNTRPGQSIGVFNHAAIVADVTCNAFDNVATPVRGLATLTDNVSGTTLPACAVPEPGTLGLLLTAGLLLGGMARRQA